MPVISTCEGAVQGSHTLQSHACVRVWCARKLRWAWCSARVCLMAVILFTASQNLEETGPKTGAWSTSNMDQLGLLWHHLQSLKYH